jgi:hypothetical protein
MFYKPCSVPSYCKRLFTSYFGGNHLSTGKCLSFSPFISFEKVPLPSFGFLARGVYRVPLLQFPARLRHCGTLKVIEPYPTRDLGSFPAVSPACSQTALAYGFARHEHYGHLSTVRAWTFLYDAYASQRLPEHY